VDHSVEAAARAFWVPVLGQVKDLLLRVPASRMSRSVLSRKLT
jgi:hypothetical protein